MKLKTWNAAACSALTLLLLSACSSGTQSSTETVVTETDQAVTDQNTADKNNSSGTDSTVTSTAQSDLEMSDYFSDRDLNQSPDLSEAVSLSLADGQQTTIDSEGIYLLSGSYTDTTIVVEAGDEDKVQLVLDGLTIENSDFPCIYVKNADKLFVTSQGSNALSVTSAFRADGDTNTDAVIFSRDDVVLNGTGSLSIRSSENGISGKDEVRITGSSLDITSGADAVEANERIAIADGTFTIQSDKDAFNAGDDDDLSIGDIIVFGGTFTINAADDGFQATTDLIIDNGTMTITSAEGLEATWVTINGGTISIAASDDGINAARKTSSGTPAISIHGGDITINMGAGDTDAVDSNGNLTITGGTMNITARSAFDVDGSVSKTGGTIYVNGTLTETISAQSMMGGGMGGRGGKFRG